MYLAADTALLQPFKDTMDDFFESGKKIMITVMKIYFKSNEAKEMHHTHRNKAIIFLWCFKLDISVELS